MTKVKKLGRFIGANWIASNSLSVNDGDLLAITAGYITKATAGDTIIWAAAGEQSFESDNQTVAKALISYVAVSDDTVLELAADAAITQANVGAHFDINANQTVDVATTAATGLAVILTKFISEEASEYKIVRDNV